jgi:hypothetical protein
MNNSVSMNGLICYNVQISNNQPTQLLVKKCLCLIHIPKYLTLISQAA